jgi:shikimate kinase
VAKGSLLLASFSIFTAVTPGRVATAREYLRRAARLADAGSIVQFRFVTYARLVARVLVTGMSGTGKSTVLAELSRRGHRTVDTDYHGWLLREGAWDAPRMDRLLADERDVVVSGTVDDQARFYDRFEHVVLISAPIEVLMERIARRTNNPYGKTAAQRAEIAGYLRTVEPLLRQGATLELDGQRPVSELADIIEALVVQAPLNESR